ncbi:hypothetical protein [Halorubrum pallidum]|uniref:Uncharacterized protein n=1 Tax=Halorubrum pallidum TaxID=1526114 RepID=A0ABD5T349_9EURY
MSAERDSDEEVQIAVDLDGDVVEIERERIETIRIDQLFQPIDDDNCDGRLQLWSDSGGWSGYERRGDELYHVNVLTETTIEG